MSEHDVKYSPQPAYNESFVPTGPPSYSEAVGLPYADTSLYPVPPSFPQQHAALPVPIPQPQVPASPTVVVPVCVGPYSSTVTCQNCHAKVKTVTKSVSQKSAHIACCLLCIFGCFLCSCIPYCMKSFKSIHHYCPSCKAFIGSYHS